MEIIKTFGDWIIDEGGITWTTHGDYFIEKSRLWETIDGNNGVLLFDWLIHMAEKKQLTSENVHELNNAFIYALDYFKELKPQNINPSLEDTLLLQKQMLNNRKK